MEHRRSARGSRLALFAIAIATASATCASCDLGNQSADAGAGGSNSGSGTVLANTCTTTFTDCGGDVTGTWNVTSICAETDPVNAVNQQNAAEHPDCTGICSSAKMTASGSVTYSSQTMSSNLAFRIVESLLLTPICFTEAAGTTLTDSTCPSFALDPSGKSNSSCSVSLSNCACQYDQTTNDNASTYAVSSNQIVEYDMTALSQQAIPYCVSGTTMSQRRHLVPPGIDYVITFTRQ